MSVAHLHLLLNHVPVIGVVGIVLLLAIALLRGSNEIAKLSLGLLILIGVVAVVVYLTGESAEELVEGIPGISESILGRHEDLAKVATIATGALGLLALSALIRFRRDQLPRWVTGSVLVASLGVSGVMGVVANTGGQIRHSEIRPGAVAAGEQDEDATSGERER